MRASLKARLAQRSPLAVDAASNRRKPLGAHLASIWTKGASQPGKNLTTSMALCGASDSRSSARSDCPLRDQLARAAAQARDHAVDQRVVGGAVDLGDVQSVLPGGQRGDLPIRQMPAKDHDPPVGRESPVEMLEAACLDPTACL